MKRGWVVLVAIALALLTLFSVHAFTTTSSLGITTGTVSRIADFTQNGFYDALVFSDRLDTTPRQIRLYKQHNNSFYLYQTLNQTRFSQCSMAYQDANKNGNLELFFACKNQSLDISIYEFNGTQYKYQQQIETQNTFTDFGFGDTLFFDFTNDGYPDIVSCYVGNGTHIEILINEQTTTNGITDYTRHTTQINTTQFSSAGTSATINQCYLVPADVNGNGLFDIIAYTYDGTKITIYENRYCNATECDKTTYEEMFVPINENTYYDASFFASPTKIKNLRAFDSNQDGFSDLYYIVQTGEVGANKTIEFGFFENKKRSLTQTIEITTPQIESIRFVQDDPTTNNYSWQTYTNAGNYYEINITPSKYRINGTDTISQNILYNINFSHDIYEFGDFFESNYDLNAGYGNLLYRTKANLSLPYLNYTVTVQAIGPSGLRSDISTPRTLNTTYIYTDDEFGAYLQGFEQEFCDGFANTNNSKIDSSFTIRFPDNTTKRVILDADNDGYYAQDYIVTSDNNEYTATFSCASRFAFLGVLPDSNDANSCIGPNGSNICTVDNGGSTNAGGGLGSTSSGGVAVTQTPFNTDTNTNIETPEQPQVPEQPASDEPESNSGNSEITKFTTTTKEFEQRYDLAYSQGRTFVTETIKKIRQGDASSVTIIKTIPKSVLTSASLLNSLTPFTIIEDDPIISFEIQNWKYLEEKTISYSFPGEITLSQLQQIQTEFTNIIYTSDINELLLELERQTQVANQSLTTQIEEKIVDNKTQLILKINLSTDAYSVSDVEVEQYFPKCLIEEITDLVLEAGVNKEFLNNVQIKEADPIIVWNFKELTNGQEIVFTLPTLRDEDCTDDVKINTLAKEFIRKNYDVDNNNLAISLMFTFGVIIFFLVLFFIATFDHGKHEKPHVQKLVKIMLRRYHKGESIEKIKASLLHEDQADVDEAALHVQNSNHFKHKWLHHVSERSVEIFIFVMLLILNVAEFSGFEFALFDWAKKLMSWMLILLLIYKVDLTKIFFNNSKPLVNWLLIIGMFLMHIKNIVSFSHTQLFNKSSAVAQEFLGVNSNFIFDLYASISNYNIYFTVYAFIAGALLICIAAAIIVFIEIKQGCLYFLVTRHPIAHTTAQKLKRFLKVSFLFFVFFFAIFNKMMEWLAISIDTFIFLATLIFFLGMIFSTKLYHKIDKEHHSVWRYIVNALTHHYVLWFFVLFIIYLFSKPFVPYATQIGLTILGLVLLTTFIVIIIEFKSKFSQLKHVSTAVDSIYAKSLKLFEYPSTIFIGISGLLILQNVVEICLFIVPQILGKETSLYSQITHNTLLSLFSNTSIIATHLFTLPLVEKIIYALLYAISIFGFFCIFFVPILLWAIYFKHREHPPATINVAALSFAEHSSLAKLIRICNYIAFPSMIVALLGGIVTITPIYQLASSSDIGVLFASHKITFSLTQALIAMSVILLYAILTKFVSRIYTLYVMFLSSIVFFVILYVVPYVQSIFHYIILTLPHSIPTLISIVVYVVLFFLAIDVLLVYVVGLLTLWYFTLPVQMKSPLLNFVKSHHLFGRYFYLTNDMMHLDYYEHARKHFVGNLVNHLENYVKHEEKQGHSIETIIMQLKLHDYPDTMIDTAVADLLQKSDFVHEIEHLKAMHINPVRIKQLTPLVQTELKRKASPNEIFEIYLPDYSYAEIKLALRYATQNTKGTVTLQVIETDELVLLKNLVENIHTVSTMSVDKIETEFVQRGYNPRYVFVLANSGELKKSSFSLLHSFELYQKLEAWKANPSDIAPLYDEIAKYTFREVLLALHTVLTEFDQSHEQFFTIHKYIQDNGANISDDMLVQKGYPQSFIDFARNHSHSKESAKFLALAVKNL
jgi:hypothetical protein